MVDVTIETVSDAGRNTGAKGQSLPVLTYRRMRRMVLRVRAAGELSCIDQRLLDDAGLTRDRYLDSAS
jgi:hypothetical protein